MPKERYIENTANEYMEIVVDHKLAGVCMECYQALGWNIISSDQIIRAHKIKMERSKKIKNRAELCKFQRTCEDAMIRLESLERIPGFVAKSNLPHQKLINLKRDRIQKKKSELYDVIYQASEQAKKLLT